MKNLILFGGSSINLNALKKASNSGAVGIITGGIENHVLNEYVKKDISVAVTGDENIPLSIILTEGFGNIKISENVLSLLNNHNGLFASINGSTQVRAGAIRPEVFIQTEDKESVTTKALDLEKGSHVRLIRHPYFGKKGTVIELPHNPETLPSGICTRVCKIEIDGQIVTVPRQNIELM